MKKNAVKLPTRIEKLPTKDVILKIRVASQLKNDLDLCCDAAGINKSELVRELLETYLRGWNTANNSSKKSTKASR